MDVSMVTSLYGSSRHLPGFLTRLEACLRSVETKGYSVESIIISNEPDWRERRMLEEAHSSTWWHDHCHLVRVPRESLYASWNRGVRAASGAAIGFWNVDDYRNPSAIAEGIEMIRSGCSIIRFPWVHVSTTDSPLRRDRDRTVVFCDQQDQSRLDPEVDFCLGPFFMFRRELFEQYGPFDEQFQIVGDYDWQLRVVPTAGLEWGQELAGVFYTDGTNLCGSGSPRQLAEQNILFKRHGLDREFWTLDSRTTELFSRYRVAAFSDSEVVPDWGYESRWRRREVPRRILRGCREMAAKPVRLARRWRNLRRG
jgi:hypothetical protein